MNRLTLSTSLAAMLLALSAPHTARAQAPAPAPLPPQQQLPQQPYPQQQFPQQQPYPQQQFPQQQPYPQQQFPQQQPYPQQQVPPQQPYPQQYPRQQPYPQQYPPQQPYPQQPYPPQYPPQGYPPPQGYAPPGYVAPSSPPVANDKRGPGEMLFLYGASIGYGVGTGVWIDALGKVSDPGVAFIAPLLLGAAAPVGVYLWDDYATFHRGVPASIATGIALGAGEGIGIAGVQWQANGNGGDGTWRFGTQTTMTWVMASGGALGGWAFGEWLRPDPRSLGFIASGAGWGALSGTLLGAGFVSGDWKDGGSVFGLIGYNAGILATGALSINYVPSWQTQKYMWYGWLGGTAAASIVYVFYLFRDNQPGDVQHGLIANGIGGLAGVGLAAALTANMKDDDQAKDWKPPFQIGFSPLPHGGAAVNAMGAF